MILINPTPVTQSNEEKVQEVNAIIKACQRNAENFIVAAKKLSGAQMRNIRYHLAALALEEIGKSSLIAVRFTTEYTLPSEKEINWKLDDHVKKLFWAFWGASFAKEKITKDLIEQYRGIAKAIHEKRLETLYVNPSSANPVKLTEEETTNILTLAESRLAMERTYGGIDPENSNLDKEPLKWFLEASDDSEKRKMIFGNASIHKLEELADSNEWIKWLYEEFKEAAEKGQKIAIKELTREKPEGDEVRKPKWEMTFTLDSESHSLRNKELDEWNKTIDYIKLYSDGKRKLICRITLPKIVHASGVWGAGFNQAKEFINAINIASGGLIFWKVSKDIDKYYDKVLDLENNTDVLITPQFKLQLDWKAEHLKLDKPTLVRTQKMLLYFMKHREDKELIDIISRYYTGLSMFAKSDLHLRLEINTFEEFYQCFKALIIRNYDLQPNTDITSTAITAMAEILKDDTSNVAKIIEIGKLLEENKLDFSKKPITLTEVAAMKFYADSYLYISAQKELAK